MLVWSQSIKFTYHLISFMKFCLKLGTRAPKPKFEFFTSLIKNLNLSWHTNIVGPWSFKDTCLVHEYNLAYVRTWRYNVPPPKCYTDPLHRSWKFLPAPKKGLVSSTTHLLALSVFRQKIFNRVTPSAHFSTQLICQRVSSLSKVIAMISLKTFLTWISDGIDTICTWHDFHFSVCNMLSSIYSSGNELAMQRYDYSSSDIPTSHWKGIFIGASHS